jgi:hypothetical protein
MGNTSLKPDPSKAIEFLRRLKPEGPWALTAIEPDGPTTTRVLHNDEEVRAFVSEQNKTKNIYYSVNTPKPTITKKANKKEIICVDFLHVDVDPAKDETSEAFIERFLPVIQAYQPHPTAIVRSGNGINALWRLAEPVELNGPASYTAVEDRNVALAEAFGADPSTRDISRILRVPGTVNYPNAAKLKRGRKVGLAELFEFNELAYPLSDFPVEERKAKAAGAGRAKGGGAKSNRAEASEDETERLIRDGCGDRFEGDRSKAVWHVCCELLRRGHSRAYIIAILLDRESRISEHIYDQAKPAEYAERQVAKAAEKITLTVSDNGQPHKSQNNVRVALLKLGVELRYDIFADRTLIDGLPGFGPTLDDAAVDRLWLRVDQRFKVKVSKDTFHTILADMARLNSFHPVRDYLDGLQWDGKPRLDRWLIEYAGVEDTEYTCAVGALLLLAAVRRVRKPGAKFDEMVVFESPEQGTEKSSALAVLAVREEWFSDDIPLNMEGKRVIEALRGRWIVEAAELSGMRRSEVEHLKAFLSRQVDRARMAYGRLVTEIPRQCVIIGTTNPEEYLRDTTGNRRFWPVRVTRFDLDALARDRDQLWAEAAAREATGASIRLDRRLWPVAAKAQRARLTQDPIFEALLDALAGMEGKIASMSVWTILDVRAGQRSQDQNQRVGAAMRQLGWRRPNASGLVKIDGKIVSGYVRGEQPWKAVVVERDEHAQLRIYYDNDDDFLDKEKRDAEA